MNDLQATRERARKFLGDAFGIPLGNDTKLNGLSTGTVALAMAQFAADERRTALEPLYAACLNLMISGVVASGEKAWEDDADAQRALAEWRRTLNEAEKIVQPSLIDGPQS